MDICYKNGRAGQAVIVVFLTDRFWGSGANSNQQPFLSLDDGNSAGLISQVAENMQPMAERVKAQASSIDTSKVFEKVFVCSIFRNNV